MKATAKAKSAGAGRAHASSATPSRGGAKSLTAMVLQLQSGAGNRAVAGLVGTPAAVQRDRGTAGWDKADTRGEGWNAQAKDDVKGSAVRRIPVDNVPGGNTARFAGTETSGGKSYDGSVAEKANTSESAANRSIVLKPQSLNVDAPIDVLLHLHGYTSRSGDPYAGWRQKKKAVTKDGAEYYQVRDVDQDRIAQQIGAAGNPQTLGILPQGVGHSRFGQLEPNAYIDAVLTRLIAINEIKKPVKGWQLSVILSGHSGGSATVSKTLRAEVAAAREKKAGKSAPSGVAEVVLFEAINGSSKQAVTEWSDYKAVVGWIDLHLGEVLAAAPADRGEAVKKCPVLRAYRSRDSYVAAYNALDKHINAWFDDASRGGQLTADQHVLLRSKFRVEVLESLTGGGGHEKVVGGLGSAGEGPLTDALKARKDPIASTLRKKVAGAAPVPGNRVTTVSTGAATVPATAKTSPSTAKSRQPAAEVPTAAAPATAGQPVITFGTKARPSVVAASSLEVLRQVLRDAGLNHATITSTARTPVDQARAMYQNLVGTGPGQGVDGQRQLYAKAGDQVIDAFVQLRDSGASAADIQAGMVAKIEAIGPGKVSRHLADPDVLNVFDVAPSSLGGAAAVTAFESAATALVGTRIERLLTPADRDPAEHFEIKPTGGGAGAGGSTASTTPPPPVAVAAPAPATSKKAEQDRPRAGAPKVPAPKTAEVGAKPKAAGATSAGTPRTAASAFSLAEIKDVKHSALRLLSAEQQQRFGGIEWNDLDYPGARYQMQDTSEENRATWDAKPGHETFKVEKKGKKKTVTTWYVRGTHQDEAQALLDALSKLRPGGGERRANTGPNAILTKGQYKGDPDAYDTYITSQLVDPEGVKKEGTRRMLNTHAASQFAVMRDAAAADGVVLEIGNSFRERAVAEANADKKKNAKAVASYSSHSLGLAMDLNLAVKGLRDVAETVTKMPNTIKMLNAPAYKWMFEFGAKYGFYQYRMEPWHWEYNPSDFAKTFWSEAPDLAPDAT